MTLNANAKPFHGGPRRPPCGRTRASARQPDQPLPVVTPWCPGGVDRRTVTLADEMAALAGLVGLTHQERRDRRVMLLRLEDCVRAVCPAAAVTAYGSYATGTSAATSAVDVLVEHWPCDAGVAEALSPAGELLSSLHDADAWFAQIRCRESGVTANVTLVAGTSPSQRQSVELTRGWLAANPAIAPALAALRQTLGQTGNMEVRSGGLSTCALVVMLAARCEGGGRTDPAALLLDFCVTYGVQWDYAVPVSVGPAPAHDSPDPVFVQDPCSDHPNNLAAGCCRLFSIRAQLQHCASALGRWSEEESTGKRSYRGKTPLSSILSHQSLQRRLEEVAAARSAPIRYGCGELYCLREEEEGVMPELVDGVDMPELMEDTPRRGSSEAADDTPGRMFASPDAHSQDVSVGDSSPPRTLRYTASADSLDEDHAETLRRAAGLM